MDSIATGSASGEIQQPNGNEVVNQTSEKMLPQSTVNELIGNAKREAAEKAATRAVEDYKRSQQEQQHYTQQQQQQNYARNLSEDDVARVAGDVLSKQKASWEKEAQEKAYAEAANRIVEAYNNKISQGREKYNDFDAVTANLDMGKYPNTVQLLADYVDNSADVLYELAKKRTNLKLIEDLGNDDPQSAIYEIKRISDSIKANDSSGQTRHPNAPLSQQRPSNTGTDSGALSMADLRRKYRG